MVVLGAAGTEASAAHAAPAHALVLCAAALGAGTQTERQTDNSAVVGLGTLYYQNNCW